MTKVQDDGEQNESRLFRYDDKFKAYLGDVNLAFAASSAVTVTESSVDVVTQSLIDVSSILLAVNAYAMIAGNQKVDSRETKVTAKWAPTAARPTYAMEFDFFGAKKELDILFDLAKVYALRT
jgi:hypothetical protein